MDRYNSRIARIIGWSHGKPDTWAVTISATCTLYSCPIERVGAKWRRHEDCHKRQIELEGWRFYPSYLWQMVTVGYAANKYEIEARGAEQ